MRYLLFVLLIAYSTAEVIYDVDTSKLGIPEVAELLRGAPPPGPIFRLMYPTWEPRPADIRDSGEPLILTGLTPEDARAKARTGGPFADLESYAGYLTVEPKYNSNLFFWYFPAENRAEEMPLVLWLQGGPGATSLFGLFTEIGPYRVTEDGSLQRMDPSWHTNHSLLFIDNPVGTGFSFTDHDDGYCRNQSQVALHLHKGLVQFFRVFPEVSKVPFYIVGESYAGKHIPSIAHEIDKRNNGSDLKINLQGIAIGNPFIEPFEHVAISEYVYNLGLIDTPTAKRMEKLELATKFLIKYKHLSQAHTLMAINSWHFLKNSNYSNMYNILHPHDSALDAEFIDFIQTPEARLHLHVGDVEFTSIGKVYTSLIGDFLNSAMDDLRAVLGRYKILLYSGHLDVIVNFPFTRTTVESITGPCPRDLWFVNGQLAGYKQECGDLDLAVILNAGHMVPTDQPEAALDLIMNFIKKPKREAEDE